MRTYNRLTPMQETLLLELAKRPGAWVRFQRSYWPTANSLRRRGMVACTDKDKDGFRARLRG